MAYKPLFSILVANYNNGTFFKDCYNSLISQTYDNWECIIVDDKSTDNSIETINSLISNDKRFKIFSNEQNKGVGYTKNKCIEFSNGEICGFVDPDDSIVTKAIEIMVSTHLLNTTASLVYSNINICDKDLNFDFTIKRKQVNNNDDSFFNLKTPIHHFVTFKKSKYVLTDGIDLYLKRAVDQDLYIKLYEKGPVVHINQDLYNYRIHQNGVSLFKNEDRAYYWHWFVINEAAKRRGVNVEDLFLEHFTKKDLNSNNIDSRKIELLKKSRLLKFLNKVGIFPIYKYL